MKRRSAQRRTRSVREISKAALMWQGLKNDLTVTDLRVREAVVSTHLGLEHLLDLVLAIPFLEPSDDKRGRYEKFMMLVAKIDFAKKIHLAQELQLLPSGTAKRLFGVNNMRVAFAHGFPRQHQHFTYEGQSSFDVFETFAVDMRDLGGQLLGVVQSAMPETPRDMIAAVFARKSTDEGRGD